MLWWSFTPNAGNCAQYSTSGQGAMGIVCSAEGGETHDAGAERVEEDAERPPVDRVLVRVAGEHLGRWRNTSTRRPSLQRQNEAVGEPEGNSLSLRHTHVRERAADGARARAAPQPLGEAQVAQLHVACVGSHQQHSSQSQSQSLKCATQYE